MPKLNSLEVVHQDTNKAKFHELHDILKRMSGGKFGALLVKKSDDDFDIGWNTELIAQLGDALAKYEYLLEVIADDKQALVREIKKLTAEFKNSDAQIIEELLVMASENQALARKITVLNAELNGNSASITQTLTTLVDNEKALAELVTELDAEFSGNIATINSTLTTLANNDSALATDITTVEARLDTGDFAAVKVQSSATASKVTGIEAKWGVTVNANGNVAGIQLLNGTNTQSSFIVDATKFIVRKPDSTNGIVWNGSLSRLDVSGDIYANNLYGTVVNTGNVVNNAITGSAVAYGTNPSVSLTTTGGRIIIQAFGTHTDPSSGGVTVSRSGGWLSNSLIGEGRFTFMYTEVLGAGTRTFSVSNGSEATLLVYELKR